MVAYGKLRVSGLRDIARSRGLKGWSKLRKDDLISFIIDNEKNYLSDAGRAEERQRQERLEKATAEANVKAAKKAKSKARRQAKRNEAKREAERRSEVKREEANQRRENVTETKSERKQRKRNEQEIARKEKKQKAREQAKRKKNPKRERKQAKRRHRATKKEARRQRLTEPAQPRLVSDALEGNVQRWFMSGEGYVDPSVFLDHTEDGVKDTIDSVNGPRKAYTSLKCTLKKVDPITGNETYIEFVGRSKNHTITIRIGNIYNNNNNNNLI